MEANIIGFVVECAKILVMLCGCMNFQIKRKPIAAIVVFTLAELCLVIKGVQDREYQVSTFMFISAMICALAVQGKRKWLFSTVAFLGISCIDSLFATIAVNFLNIPEKSIYSEVVGLIGINAISLLLLAMVALLLQKFYYKNRTMREKMKNEIQQSSKSYLGLLAIGLFAVLWLMPVSRPSFQWNTITERIIIVMVYVFAIAFLVIGILLIFYHRSSNHYQELAKMNQSLLESKERYYQMMLEKEEETRRFRHDMSAHVTCVKQLLTEEINNCETQ